MSLQARQYQTDIVNDIKIGKTNLVVSPMRSGKSFIMELIVDKYNFNKVLILVGYRKIVIQLKSYFTDNYTHILSGEQFDNEKRVHLASWQTFNRRDIDIHQYDCVIVDEYHSRNSKRVNDFLSSINCTKILLTGTPLTQKNNLLTKNIDHTINKINMRQMVEQGYIAPTKFYSNSNMLEDDSSMLKTGSSGDFTSDSVKQVMKKNDLLQSIADHITDNDLLTNHKTLIYVNFIESAEELYELLSAHDNVFIIHSKLPQKEQDKRLAAYESATNAAIISVRSLSLGFDSPTSDYLIYGLLTKIQSLALQILWRSSTLNPANPNKVATVVDMLGQLAVTNPYEDFTKISKRPDCKDECLSFKKPIERFMCMESCKGEPPMTECNGKLPHYLVTSEFVTNFTKYSGNPCGEQIPVHNMQFTTTDIGYGMQRKWSKCQCGFTTYYDIQTKIDVRELIEMYELDTIKNTVSVIFNRKLKQAVALLDNPDRLAYKIVHFDSSEKLLELCANYFNDKPFKVISNVRMDKVSKNIKLDKSLDIMVELVNWDTNNNNAGLPKKIAKIFLQGKADIYGYKKGYVYYKAKTINDSNIKHVLTMLTNGTSMSVINKYFTKEEHKQKKRR